MKEYTCYVGWDRSGFNEVEVIDVSASDLKSAMAACKMKLLDEYDDGGVIQAVEDDTGRIIWRL